MVGILKDAQACEEVEYLPIVVMNRVDGLAIHSDVPARLGLKAAALAWLLTAWAFRNCRPGQSRQ